MLQMHSDLEECIDIYEADVINIYKICNKIPYATTNAINRSIREN